MGWGPPCAMNAALRSRGGTGGVSGPRAAFCAVVVTCRAQSSAFCDLGWWRKTIYGFKPPSSPPKRAPHGPISMPCQKKIYSAYLEIEADALDPSGTSNSDGTSPIA